MKKRVLIVVAAALLVTIGLLLWHDSRVAAPTVSPSLLRHAGSSQPSSPASGSDFNKNQFSTTDPTSPWVVVNKQHPLNPKDYAPSDLTAVGNGQYMRAEAAAALKQMLAGAAAAGYSVTPASGYRSYNTQVSVYANEVTSYGQAVADSESARPGYSEHQTGWAMDLASGGCSITDCFGDTAGGQWIIANSYRYGFIQRYPADKVDITGYRDETWHFRYVGVPLATELHDLHIETLEKFFGISGGTSY